MGEASKHTKDIARITYKPHTHYTLSEVMSYLKIDPQTTKLISLTEHRNKSYPEPFYVKDDVDRAFYYLQSIKVIDPPYNPIDHITISEAAEEGNYTYEEIHTLIKNKQLFKFFNTTCPIIYFDRLYWRKFCEKPKWKVLVKRSIFNTASYSYQRGLDTHPDRYKPAPKGKEYSPFKHYKLYEVAAIFNLCSTQLFYMFDNHKKLKIYANNSCKDKYTDRGPIDTLIKEILNKDVKKMTVAYIRDASEDEINLQLQIDEINQFAEENNVKIDRWYEDKCQSTEKDMMNANTSSLYELVNDILRDRVSRVIAYSKRRISYHGDSALFSIICSHKHVADMYVVKTEKSKLFTHEAETMVDSLSNIITPNKGGRPKGSKTKKKKGYTKMKRWNGYGED